MKKFLLETRNNSPKSFSATKKLYLAVILSIIGFTVNAQCIGPYARFESFAASGTNPATSTLSPSFTTSSTKVQFGSSATVARSGTFFCLTTANAEWLMTPEITNPKTFSFYIKTTTGLSYSVNSPTSFLVEYSTSTNNFVTSTPFANISTISGATLTLPAAATATYNEVSITGLAFGATTGVKFRITDTNARATSAALAAPPATYFGQLQIDDVSWESNDATANNIIVPKRTGNATLTDCGGGAVTLGSGDFYNFYDNGGPSDQYNISQGNQVTFTPSNYALGDRIRVQFISYTGAVTTDNFQIWDDSAGTTNNILNHTATTIPAVPTYISTSTVSSNGSLTLKFSSDLITNAAGFNIKVDCVRCDRPTGLTSSAVGSTTATVSWNATTAGAYDIYYSTTTSPNLLCNVTPQVLNLTGTTYNFTGLISGQTYYVWVRSKCAYTPSPDSYSPWSVLTSFTTTNCSGYAVSTPPSIAGQNLCQNDPATPLTVAATGTVALYEWFSNNIASTTGGTPIGTNSSSYTPLTTSLGTLYYFCTMTSTISCKVTTFVSGAITVTTSPPVASVATAATAVTTSGFTANWGAVSGATGYYLDVATDVGFTTFVTGYSNLNVGNVITYPVTGLNSTTTYYYRVRAYNSCGPTASSNTITQTTNGTTYCTPTYASGDLGFGDNITNVTLGTLNNSSTTSASPFYTYFNAVTIPTLYQGATVPISISFGGDGNQYAAVWIDFNKDGIFQSSEGFASLTNAGSNGTTTINIAVPSGALLGNTRMRVRVGDDSALNGTQACGASNSTWGETEDYIVNIITVPPCAVSTPSSLNVTNVNATTATLVWSDPAMTPNTIYNWYINTTNVAPPNNGTDPSPLFGTVTGALSANVSGLTVGITYYFWVRTKCDATHYSNWVACPLPFTTATLDIVNMTNGSISTCNARFYDSGGSVGSYAVSESYIYTFNPASGSNLKVVFNSFQTESNYDFLTIYDGPNTTFPSLGTFSGTQIAAGQAFYSTATNGGSLTFKFTSDASVQTVGWDATITCVIVPTISLVSPITSCAGATPTITLTGTNFTGTTSVSFNGISVVPLPANISATSITVTLPAGATTGPVKVNTTQASVTYSLSNFIVKPVPTTPNAGADVVICSGQSTNLVATSTPTTNSLTTTAAGGNGCSGGNMFNIVTGGSPVTVYAFDVTPNSTAVQNVNVYYKVGTYVGSETTSGAWTLLGTYSINGVAKTLINMPTANLNIPAGSTYGIYINYDAVYTTGTGNYSNSDITINAGAGLCGLFTSVNTPRIFNGTVYYQLSLPVTYAWTPTGGLSNAAIYNPVASPTTTQTYSVTTSYNTCTSAPDTVVVTANPTPTITASASTAALCYSATSQTVPLNYSATTGSPTTYSITWNASPANSFVAVSNATLTAGSITINVPAGTAGGTYTGNLTVKNASGCVSTVSTFTISVSPQVSIAGINAIAVCGGVSSTVLPFSSISGSPVSYSITWNTTPANTFVAVTDAANSFLGTTLPIAIPGGTAAGLYTGNISVKNAAGCASTPIPFNLNISLQPTVTLAASASPVCFSSSAQTTTLSYNTPVGSPIKYTLAWGASAISAGFTNITVLTALPVVIGTTPITLNIPANAPAATYSGSITVINAGGCQSASLPFTLDVIAKPTLTSSLIINTACVSSSAQVTTMNYTATTSSPTSFSIDWNAAANTAGILDQGTTAYAFSSGSGSISPINIAANIPASQYTGVMTITNANGCTNTYTVTIYVGKKWNGTTSTDWATASNWTPVGAPTSTDYCVIIPSSTPFSPIISAAAYAGDLTIYTGATLTVNSGVALQVQDFVKTDGTLTMNSSSSLVQVNNVANSGSGNIVYKRDVNGLHGYDYVYWSSPVAAQPITTLYSTPPLGYRYYWDTLVDNGNGTGGNTSQGNWAGASGNMTVGKGYIIRGSTVYGWTGNLTSTFTGIPNNGTLTTPIYRGSFQGTVPYVGINGVNVHNVDDNMNLIGNPYPSAIKASDFIAANTNIDGFVFLWTHNSSPATTSNPFYSTYTTNYFSSDYITYNGSGPSSQNGFNGKIAAGQGFFVVMADGPQDATQTVTFNNAMRSNGYDNTQFFKTGQMVSTTEDDKHRIWIDLVDATNNSSRALVAYCQGATNLKDRIYDAFAKVTNANILYSLIGNESQVIQGRALPFDQNDQVPLGYHAETAGTFTIAISGVDGLFEQGQSIYLQDNLLGIIYDLRSNPYVFSTQQGTFNDRFVLRYTNGLLSSNQINPKSSAFAFITNTQLQIKANENITSVQVFDVTGKLIRTYTPSTKSNQFKEDFSFEKGVYFAKIKLEEGNLVTQKITN